MRRPSFWVGIALGASGCALFYLGGQVAAQVIFNRSVIYPRKEN